MDLWREVSHTDDRVALLLSSPVAASFLVRARTENLQAAELADQGVATALAAQVVSELNPWWGGSAARRTDALRAVTDLAPFARGVVSDERTRWWWQDVARDRQFWVTDARVDPASFDVAATVSVAWNTYAQHPVFDECVDTSTELDVRGEAEIRSGLHTELSDLVLGDWAPTYPLRQSRLRVAPSARVYEIHSAADWHRLARRYADRDAYRGPDPNLLSAAGLDHGVGPAWERVAADWDGVHLSLFGLLTALYTPVSTDGETTTLWTWCCERTVWLRNVFDEITNLPPLTGRPAPPQI